MGEQYLTMAEIEKLYPNQWVLIDRPTTQKRNPATVTGGYVVMHTPDRAELDRRLLSLRENELLDFAVLYTGRPPAEGDQPLDLFWFKHTP
jgi:hypothetical protein